MDEVSISKFQDFMIKYRNRIWHVVPIINNPRDRKAYSRVREIFGNSEMPYFFGRMCRRNHDHFNGKVLRRWSDDWCVQCRNGTFPTEIFSRDGNILKESVTVTLSNDFAESLMLLGVWDIYSQNVNEAKSLSCKMLKEVLLACSSRLSVRKPPESPAVESRD